MNTYRLRCSEIWGGTAGLDQDVETEGLAASVFSAATDGGRGGDIHYVSVCTKDVITRIAVADVLGHGEGVTLVSSWVYAALQAQMDAKAGDRVLSDLNAMICARGFEAMTTAAVLSHDRSTSSLHFSYAGHPPAIIWRAGNGWQQLESPAGSDRSNMVLGVHDSAVYEQGQVLLTCGDRVLIYTDGLLDAEDPHGEPFGHKSLFQVLNGEGGSSIRTLKRAILAGLAEHKRDLLMADDLTVLAAEIR